MRFDGAVPSGGYAWWYLDALSDDRAHGLTLIAFVGSVFSPYYAWARRGGMVDPVNHCALNVALYGARGARWCMTERGAENVIRTPRHFAIGRSTLDLTGDALTIAVDEVCAPLPRRLKGSVRLIPSALGTRSFFLDGAGRHRWTPIAPCARVEVRLSEPSLTWSGSAYLDSNAGDEPLEDGFQGWTWSRASLPDGTAVLYDVMKRAAAKPTAAEHAAAHAAIALRFSADAVAHVLEPPPIVDLPRTGWRIPRQTRADAGHGARVVETLEDAPFYSRSLLDTRIFGMAAPAIHESLDLDRFRARWVQCLLPFRMPRRIL